MVRLYEVTGEFDIVTLISVDQVDEFTDVLYDKIMKIKGEQHGQLDRPQEVQGPK